MTKRSTVISALSTHLNHGGHPGTCGCGYAESGLGGCTSSGGHLAGSVIGALGTFPGVRLAESLELLLSDKRWS